MRKTVQYSSEEEQQLMAFLWSPAIADDPYAFVMAVYPWGEEGTPLAKFKGPRKWQIKILNKIRDHIRMGKVLNIASLLRLARSSGRGIGKSALVSWIIHWFVTTRIGATAIVSANTETQLRNITFAELGKWTAMLINSHWWEVVGIKMDPAKWLRELVERDLKKGTELWGADGKLWSEDNPDAYAGVHNHDGVLLIFDEASGIPDKIWAVGGGFFTEETHARFWIAFSQGRRNSGYFFEIFNKKRDLWDNDQIDARTVEGTDKKIYQEIIDEYGEDSDEAKVEVYGQFPSNDDISFISVGTVDRAINRARATDLTAPIIIGVDPSGGGSDWFVIVVRQGKTILKVIRFKITDDEMGTMEGVGHIIQAIEDFKPTLTVCDVGMMGGPIADRCNEQKYKVRKVNFSWKSSEPQRYGNKRAEMWGKTKKWLETAILPDDARLKTDLTGVRKKPDSKGVLWLESKKDMRSRGLASPDSADALAVTFAFPVAHREGMIESEAKKRARTVQHSGLASQGWMGS